MLDQQEHYPLNDDSSQHVSISWGFFSQEIIVYVEGNEIGRIPRSQLTQPHEFCLRNGDRLTIQQRPSLQILGMSLQPYLHLTLNGQVLPGVIAKPQQLQRNGQSWILALALLKFLQALMNPIKVTSFPTPVSLQSLVEWQQGFTGAIATGILLLLLLPLFKYYTRTVLAIALAVVLGNFVLELTCIWICTTPNRFYLAAIEGIAAIALYKALKVTQHHA